MAASCENLPVEDKRTAGERMEAIISLSKRRGFIFPSGEIYGGISGFWDYGPLGVEMKRNLRASWWQWLVTAREDIVGLDSAIITHPETWASSGHVDHFHDLMVDCKKCKKRFKADDIVNGTCPNCGSQELTAPREFHLMMKTQVGAATEAMSAAYLRPETCQSIFTDFDLVAATARCKLPFGVAQIGKAFRNEINPRNYTARSREFEQMEVEFFCRPEESERWFEHFKDYRRKWYHHLGFHPDKLRFREHEHKELAHYAKRACDIEYCFPFGWMECEGIHDRGDFDLRQHQEHSGKNLEYFDADSNEHFIPHVVETSAGLDRIMLAVLCDAYDVDVAPTGPEARQSGREEEESRAVLRLSPLLAPVKVAVLPLRRKLAEPAHRIYEELRRFMSAEYDETGSIGKRYRRQDEVGTPWGVTYDFESPDDNKVTVRDRDTLKQDRIEIAQLTRYLRDKLDQHRLRSGAVPGDIVTMNRQNPQGGKGE